MMDNKEKWKRYLSSFKDDMICVTKDPIKGAFLWWSIKYPTTIYESPKTFINDAFAFNDGSWLRFPKEYRTKDGKPKAIYLKTTKDVIKELAFFCRFQRLLGVSMKEELVYHMLCFMCDVVKIHSGAFDFNEQHKKVLFNIADRILSTEVKQDVLDKLRDNRSFCIEQKKLKYMDKNQKTRLQAKGRRIYNYMCILKKYDDCKSISQNAVACETSISTIKRFKKHKLELERFIRDNRIKVKSNEKE